jgi:hypothetical protein
MCVVGVAYGRNTGRNMLRRIFWIQQIINIEENSLVIYTFVEQIKYYEYFVAKR